MPTMCWGEAEVVNSKSFCCLHSGIVGGSSFFYLFLFCLGIPGVIAAGSQQLFINFLEIDV